MTAPGPKVPLDSALDTADIDDGWADAEADSDVRTNPVTKADTDSPTITVEEEQEGATIDRSASTVPPSAGAPPSRIITESMRHPMTSAPEIIIAEEDPIEFDGDHSRPTLPVPNPLKYDIVPESERSTAIPPDPRAPKVGRK